MIIFDVGDLVWCLECMLLFLLVCSSRVRARVIDYDTYDKLWGIKYDSDHKTEDLNAEEMMKWVLQGNRQSS